MSNRLEDPKKHDKNSDDANDISSIMKDAIAAAVQAGVSAGISEGMKQIREERNNDNQSGPYYNATADFDDEWNRERSPQDVGYDSVFSLLSSPDDMDDDEVIDDLVHASMLQLHQLPDSSVLVNNPLLNTGTIPDFAKQEYGYDEENTDTTVVQSEADNDLRNNDEQNTLSIQDNDKEEISHIDTQSELKDVNKNLPTNLPTNVEDQEAIHSESLADDRNVADKQPDDSSKDKIENNEQIRPSKSIETSSQKQDKEDSEQNNVNSEEESIECHREPDKLENATSKQEHNDPIIALYESGAFWQPDPDKSRKKKRIKKMHKDSSSLTRHEFDKTNTLDVLENDFGVSLNEDDNIDQLISEEEFASLLGSVDENNTFPKISVPDEAELKSISELFEIAFEKNNAGNAYDEESDKNKQEKDIGNDGDANTANERISNSLIISQEMSRFLNETYNIPESEMDALYKSYGELFGDDETGYKTPSFVTKKKKKLLHREEPVPAMLDAYGKPLKSPSEATTLEELGISKDNLPKTGLLLIPSSNGIKTLKAPLEAVALDIPGENSASMLIECRDASIIEWDLGAILTESDLDIVAFWLNGSSESFDSKCRVSWNDNDGLTVLTMSKGKTGVLSASRVDDLFEDFSSVTTTKKDNGIEENVEASTAIEAVSNLPELDINNATIAYKFAGIVFMLHFFSNNSDIEVSWKQPKYASDGLVTGFFANLAESIAEYGYRGRTSERKTVKHKTQASWFADHAAAYDYMFIGREDEKFERRLKQIGIDSNGELLARVVEPRKVHH